MPELLAGRYRIDSPLGAGGMGEVFLAHDTRLERRVAIKWLHPHHEQDLVARERLRREALAAAALDHPYICKIHEIGDADGRTFIVMEYVEGETLQVAAGRELLPVRQIVDIAHELVQALEEAHGRGVVHRDLKPSNVMVTRQGHVKVLDFGLAKQTFDAAPDGIGSDAGTRLTDAGTRLGTPAYMSPEQVRGGSLDHRSDMFSLGVLLHELATGAHPFLRADAAETMAAILRDPPSSGRRDVNSVPGLGVLLQRMLAKASSERVQTMSELRVELEALRERVWASTSSGSVASASALPAERTPLVGREAEAAELRRALDRMLTGHGGFALIGGEPGIGKTRLALELMREAHQRGCLCLTGRCTESEGAPPFAPFIEMIEQAVRLVPQAVRTAMGDVAPEIATMVPSLRRSYLDISAPSDVPANQRRRLLFSAYLDYVQRAAKVSPGVVLVDDLHWADEPSLELLVHIAPHLPSMRLLVVGTYRDVELDVARPFANALETLIRQRFATRMTARRLTESGVHQMLSAMGGAAAPSRLTQAVFRETEGNPFFVEEVYQHLAEEGRLFDDGGAWKGDLRVDMIDVPEGVRLVLGRRLDRLGDRARKVLTAAAVIGRTFPIDVLQAVVDLSEDEVLDALEGAEHAQLVGPDVRERTTRYAFVHELIRTTLVQGLSLPRRQRMHLKIADAVERLRATSLDSQASVLAHHLYQAGTAAETPRTAKFLELVGRRSIVAGAFEEALDTVDRLIGLELGDDDPLLAEAWEHRGAAFLGLQRTEGGVVALERALALYVARCDDAGIVRITRALAWSLTYGARAPDAVAVLSRGLNALSASTERERANLLSLRALTQSLLGELDDWRSLDEAAAIAERLGESPLLGQVLFAKAVLLMSNDLEAARDTTLRARPLVPKEALWDRANLLGALAQVTFHSGRLAELDDVLAECEGVASRAGNHFALWICEYLRLGRELMRSGDLRAHLGDIEQVLRRQPRASVAFFVARALAADDRLHLGEVEDALEQLRIVAAESPPQLHFKGLADANLFAGLAWAGRIDRAHTQVRAVEGSLPVLGRPNPLYAWWALETTVAGLALIGDRERCAALYPLTVAYVNTGQVCGSMAVGPGNPQLAAAIAAGAAGYSDHAREHFETAFRQARELPDRLLQPTVLFWYGRTLLAESESDEQERGRAMVEASLTDFRALEMVTHANLAEQSLRR